MLSTEIENGLPRALKAMIELRPSAPIQVLNMFLEQSELPLTPCKAQVRQCRKSCYSFMQLTVNR